MGVVEVALPFAVGLMERNRPLGLGRVGVETLGKVLGAVAQGVQAVGQFLLFFCAQLALAPGTPFFLLLEVVDHRLFVKGRLVF